MRHELTASGHNRSLPPLVAHFRTPGGGHYIYDAPTNDVIEVSPETWQVTAYRQFWLGSKDGRGDEISNEIKRALGEGFFKTARAKRVSLMLDRTRYWHLLESSLSQLTLGVSEGCNFRCRYCVYSGHYKDQRAHGNQIMSAETAQAAIDFFLKRNYASEKCYIGFYGGEPTLGMNTIRSTVDYIHSKAARDVTFNMTTNGYAMSEEDMRFYIKEGVVLLVSLDGPRERHDRFRITAKGHPTFARIYRNLSRLRELDKKYFRTKVGLSIVIGPPYNIRELRDYFEKDPLLKDLRLSVNSIGNNSTTFFQSREAKEALEINNKPENGYEAMLWEYKRNLIEGEPLRDRFLSAMFMASFLRLYKGGTYNGFGDLIPMNGSCIPGIRRLFVTPSGEFYPCEKVNNTIRIGNIADGFDFAAATRIIETYISHTSEACVECFANRYCGACPATCFSRNGFHGKEKKALCESTRVGMLNILAHYFDVLEKNPAAFDFMAEIDMS